MTDRLTHYSSMHPFIHPSIFDSFLASFTSEKGYLAEVERKSQALLKSPQLNFQQLYSVFAEGLTPESDAVPAEVLQLNDFLLNTTSMATNSTFREAALQELWNQAVTPLTEVGEPASQPSPLVLAVRLG